MKPTLGQVFTLSLLALAAALGVLFYIIFHATGAAVVESSEQLRDRASREISGRVMAFLAKAPNAVRQIQLTLNRGLVDCRDAHALEAALFAPLLADPDIGEMTFTYGRRTGFDANGAIQLEAAGRGQLSVVRTPDKPDGEKLWSQHVHEEAGAYVADRRELGSAENSASQPVTRETGTAIADPTTHPTFTTPASKEFYGRLLWSDLHYSQLDAGIPEAQRRVEVSVQQVITDAAGEFAGVLRVGLLARQLDRAVQFDTGGGNTPDAHRVFLCDAQGRVITRGVATDRVAEIDDDLRIPANALPEPFAEALAEPRLARAGTELPVISCQFIRGGEEYLTTFRALPPGQTQDWIVGIVVPRSFYLGKLSAMRGRLLLVALAIIALVVAGGAMILRGVKRAQSQIVDESLKMNSFEFSAAPTASAFRDVTNVLDSLEQAKTAMRAMGKYVPVDLVRRLYREKSEPALGGVATEISIMFTDIRDFTAISEQLDPAELATALGRYLEAMARVIQRETRGTIDKYIGDAIMTFWNAPEPVPDHAQMACRAALRCRDAGRTLARSPEWRGLPEFETRFGLHRAEALVGHFGAPDRMNYTAIGDAVNLASRLEGLNKQYGTTIIASERIVEKARGAFVFRLLDIVAVKGKSEAIRIFELLGEQGADNSLSESIANYEKAFEAYLARDFTGALALLAGRDGDPPSVVLAERCRGFLAEPPPADWRGIYVATAK
jgi:adenylate cyclase